ncbi:Uncharacterised protein [Legionella busanensis]|uniref:Uncharacterized protein n=1 Tax=Legionella busanensis TaxID=190655 RepID=A0A378JPI3_9GAMM|nr:hypothetical protein [Legionella busanensis]STX52193.1 Uncharacterised protein [Legionella busanensis]
MQQLIFRISILLLAITSSYSEASENRIRVAAVPQCKDIQVPDVKNIQISNQGNLYTFKFTLPSCGHSSYQVNYPTAYIVQELIDGFYKEGLLNLTVNQDPQTPLAKDQFLLEVQQSLFNDRFVFKEEVQLAYERNYIHMINQSHIIPGSVSKALEPFKALRDMQWKNDCQQESAGWCFTWDGYFAITWDWNGKGSVDEMKNYVIKTILPQIFRESYIRYEQYVYKAANS